MTGSAGAGPLRPEPVRRRSVPDRLRYAAAHVRSDPDAVALLLETTADELDNRILGYAIFGKIYHPADVTIVRADSDGE